MKKIYKEAIKSEIETNINVLYSENKIVIYTNKVSLQKQLNKLIGEPTKEYKIKRSIANKYSVFKRKRNGNNYKIHSRCYWRKYQI